MAQSEPIIGLDFGNCFSFPCYIPDLDITVSRLGGTPRDLLPPSSPYGYPSVFFYSMDAAEKAHRKGVTPPPWCGADAVRQVARPEKNRIRNLKRHLAQPLELDDWNGGYDEAIVLLIQYLIRQANYVLRTEWMLTSSKLSLSYPATYTRAQCRHLKNLAERATLEDGRHIQVVGMIAEPAAAALDYLVEHQSANKETTVLTYDLGGGTFDLAIVSAYPNGRKNKNGSVYYYDIECTGGIKSLGGNEFDEIMFNLLLDKIPSDTRVRTDVLRPLAEKTKIELSTEKISSPYIMDVDGDYLDDLFVTREEFEQAARPLVEKTIAETRRILEAPMNKPPELIVLTGAASQMPMIKAALEQAFPQFKGKVINYRPSRAVSYGAARYGTPEGIPDDPGAVVQQRVPRDIGIRTISKDEKLSITHMIHAGEVLPFDGSFTSFTTHIAGDNITFSVFEALVDKPNSMEIDRDYTRIMSVVLNFGRTVPADTPVEARLSLDKDALLVIQARDPANPGMPPVQNECILKNLS